MSKVVPVGPKPVVSSSQRSTLAGRLISALKAASPDDSWKLVPNGPVTRIEQNGRPALVIDNSGRLQTERGITLPMLRIGEPETFESVATIVTGKAVAA